MDYKKIYESLVHKARMKNRKKVNGGIYYERHHIIPKCLGGTNDDDNLVLLTAREHYVAHKLLSEVYPDNKKLFHAYYIMTFTKKKKKNYIVTSREYERLKIIQGKNMSYKRSEEIIEKYRTSHIGQKPSEQTLEKRKESFKKIPKKYCEWCKKSFKPQSFANFHGDKCKLNPNIFLEECGHCGFKDRPNSSKFKKHHDNCKHNPNKEKKELKPIQCPYCDFVGYKMKSMIKNHFDNCKYKDDPNYDENKKKQQYLNLSLALTGRKQDQKVIEKRNESMKNIEKLQCPHCNRLFRPSVAHMWHFDNCKMNPNYNPETVYKPSEELKQKRKEGKRKLPKKSCGVCGYETNNYGHLAAHHNDNCKFNKKVA